MTRSTAPRPVFEGGGKIAVQVNPEQFQPSGLGIEGLIHAGDLQERIV